MKPAGILALILIVVGVIVLGYGGYTSFTTKENVAKLGPLEINKNRGTSRPDRADRRRALYRRRNRHFRDEPKGLSHHAGSPRSLG